MLQLMDFVLIPVFSPIMNNATMNVFVHLFLVHINIHFFWVSA